MSPKSWNGMDGFGLVGEKPEKQAFLELKKMCENTQAQAKYGPSISKYSK